ncbi:MAG: LysR substrate-binding domain-containing protein [Candidatus Protistobacter heckmanni]|nr:LysR substrate-binding domain-containing protein [Candidatus Protistobacter heckmanni]
MELRHLHYFSALAECLNFTHVAAKAHVTQSTLSHQIKQLEEELNQQLFHRSGERFLAYARNALAQVDASVHAISQGGGELAGEIRICTTHSFGIKFIPDCLTAFLVKHPTVHVTVEELSSEGIDQGLAAGQLDIVLAYRPADLKNLWFEPLYHEEMLLLVVADTHPLARRQRIRMVELSGQPVVVLTPNFLTRWLLDECLAGAGAEPLVAQMNSVAPITGLVRRTGIATILSKNAVADCQGLRFVPIEDPTPVRTPGLLWKRGAARTPILESFVAIVRKEIAWSKLSTTSIIQREIHHFHARLSLLILRSVETWAETADSYR